MLLSDLKKNQLFRKGEYEGLAKLGTEDSAPDFGPNEFNDMQEYWCHSNWSKRFPDCI